MRYAVEWLAEHVDLDGIDASRLADAFTLHCAESELAPDPGGGWPGVAVARVTEIRPHPKADRLLVARLETGDGEREVVCGAPNIAAGQRVLYAPAGATLPGGLVLERRKIRGVVSTAMVLSERELGIGEDNTGIVVLDGEPEVGTPAVEVLSAGPVLEVDNTAITTRPDLWGHYGVARELAAVFERELRALDRGEIPARLASAADSPLKVTVEDFELCPRC
ncbi:MAG: hypothetical protein ACE5JG_01605 [Planctomycetota bacterium]